ncbi:MAG: hypothetical protein QOJ19_544 [Acidimicrobiia bacterium]|nr:hypothetical protein [Acidimicrobiia bacterium]
MTNITSGVRRVVALTILLAVLALVGTANDVGAVTPHYQAMADRSSSLKCDDFKYATSRGLIDPVEVLWLLDTHPQPLFCADIANRPDFIQTNRAYYVMLAEAAKGQLTCDDIRWNSRYGFVHYDQAGDLLPRVPGCQLDDYEFLVVLAYGERPFTNRLGVVTSGSQLRLACP